MAHRAGMEAHVEATLGCWLTPDFSATRHDAVDPVAAMIASTPVESYASCAEAIKRLDLLGRIFAIDLPALAIVGDQDPGTTPEAARAIQQRIAGQSSS